MRPSKPANTISGPARSGSSSATATWFVIADDVVAEVPQPARGSRGTAAARSTPSGRVPSACATNRPTPRSRSVCAAFWIEPSAISSRDAVAVEVGDRRRRVGEVRLLVDGFVVGVALLRERVVDHPADAGELGAVVEDRRGVERAAGAVVQRQVRVVLGREDVGAAVAVDVAEREVLVVAAGHVARVVAAGGAGGVRREARRRRCRRRGPRSRCRAGRCRRAAST